MLIIKLLVFCSSIALIPVTASGKSLFRDADIEYAFAELAKPVLQAAGLSPSGIKIMLINDKRPNAFIIDHKHIFITSGLALKTRTAEMFQSIIAHEAAHIAYGHVTRRGQNVANARTVSAFGIALGIMTAGMTNSYELGTSLALGASGSARGALLAHTRVEESAADQAAMSYMAIAGIDGQGMVDVLNIFIGQDNLSAGRQDPYARSHPLSQDRLRVVKGYVKNQPKPKDKKMARYWHDRAIGKLSAFLRSSEWTLKNAQNSSYNDVRHLRRSVALSRQGKLNEAIIEIEKAQHLKPKDAYLQELKAELYMRHKQFRRAAREYEKASELDPANALILAGYGRALLAARQTTKALAILKKSRERDFRNTRMMRDLAVAFSKTGENGMASLITAERFALEGKIKDAQIHARRALAALPRGSPGWQNAEDILDFEIDK